MIGDDNKLSSQQTLIGNFLALLTPQLAVLLLLTAAYLLIFCTKDAKTKNHRQAEKAARIGGRLYAALAAAILAARLF